MERADILLAGIVVIAIIAIIVLIFFLLKVNKYYHGVQNVMNNVEWNEIAPGESESPAQLRKTILSYTIAMIFIMIVFGVATSIWAGTHIHKAAFTLVLIPALLTAAMFLFVGGYVGATVETAAINGNYNVFTDKSAYRVYFMLGIFATIGISFTTAALCLTNLKNRGLRKSLTATSSTDASVDISTKDVKSSVNSTSKQNWRATAAPMR
jgi:glucose-6-phosphate-specific signal transduction histidine kinase